MGKKYKSPRNTGEPSLRKFKGFGFYLMGTDKLSKKNREILLLKSEDYIGEVVKSLNLSSHDLMTSGIGELDPNLTDLELLEQWNHMYDTYGYLMSDFKEKWEKERLRDLKNNSFKQSKEFEELSERVSQLESEMMRLKVELLKSNNRVVDMG